jgi:DNA-binding LytR/AlgR family response regulator
MGKLYGINALLNDIKQKGDVVIRMEGNGNSATVWLETGGKKTIGSCLSRVKRAVNDPHLICCHQSKLVNYTFISEVWEKSNIILMAENKHVTISRGKHDAFIDFLRRHTQVHIRPI